MHTTTGVFVAFEGGDGTGKSTQARALSGALSEAGYRTLLTFEPGDTAVGKEMRRIVLDPATGELSHRTEVLLYAADKSEHVDTVVMPALRRGEVVITDRYVDSMLAYQGAGRALDLAEVEQVARWATRDLRPDLTVVLTSSPPTGSAGSTSATGSRARRPSSSSARVRRSWRWRRPIPTTTSWSTRPGRLTRSPRSC